MPTVEVDTRVLNRILSNLGENTDAFVRKVAFDVQALAQDKAPVDLGNLKNSIYTATNRENRMPVLGGDVRRVALPSPTDDHTAHVGPSVDYGIYQEFGTYKMAPHPYLGPAVLQTTNDLRRYRGDLEQICTNGE
jgi:HK97 gp10 family phage protein